MFNHGAPYRNRLPTVYLFMADNANPELFVLLFVGYGVVATSPAFTGSSDSRPAGPHDRLVHKTVNRAPICQNRCDSSTTHVCSSCSLTYIPFFSLLTFFSLIPSTSFFNFSFSFFNSFITHNTHTTFNKLCLRIWSRN